jgi:hypothetical protein
MRYVPGLEAERHGGRKLADLNLWYRLVVPAGTDAVLLLDALRALPVVEFADGEPLPSPQPTADFSTL